MGGNTALNDTATALPMLTRLASLASSSGKVDDAAVVQACREYEDEMMPRAFGWVKASGGANMVVSVVSVKIDQKHGLPNHFLARRR
jgi:hypothetical protein